jgi:hypothetical protein
VTLPATVSVHVVSLPWSRSWRSSAQVRATKRLLGRLGGVRFAVTGRASGGGGLRHVNRTLSWRRTLALVEWESGATAAAGRGELDEHWRAQGAEVWSATLVPFQSKGTWRGVGAFPPAAGAVAGEGVVASLTYARIKPSRMWSFYMRGFPKTARRATGRDSTMIAGIGFGDVPVSHACTFSLWPSSADVARFAYADSGAHGPVQARSRREAWLSESLFARFTVGDHAGSWAGRDPLG